MAGPRLRNWHSPDNGASLRGGVNREGLVPRVCRLPAPAPATGRGSEHRKKKTIHLIEINWGEPISLIAPNGEEQRFSTLETVRYWLRRKWPVSDEARHRALTQVEAAMDCLLPAAAARKSFLKAALTAGFVAAHVSGENGA